MRAMLISLVAIVLVCAVASFAEACDRCQVGSTSSIVVCDRVVGEFQVVERTVVQKDYFVRPAELVCERCHLRHSLYHCVGRVVDIGRATVGTIYDTGATTVRVVASVPIEIGGLAHRTVHRLDKALFEGRRRPHRSRD